MHLAVNLPAALMQPPALMRTDPIIELENLTLFVEEKPAIVYREGIYPLVQISDISKGCCGV